jgi:hypothetical protein
MPTRNRDVAATAIARLCTGRGIDHACTAVEKLTPVGGEIANAKDHTRAKSEVQLTTPAPGRSPMQQGQPGRAASIVGFILIFMGIISLAYFASPIRLMLRETIGRGTINLVPPILGGLALCSGIALLFSVRQRPGKKKEEP